MRPLSLYISQGHGTSLARVSGSLSVLKTQGESVTTRNATFTRNISYDYLPRPRHEYTDGPAPPPPRSRPELSNEETVDKLAQLFPTLVFPPEVAQRIITHASWNKGLQGHNGRFIFIGRRVLRVYAMLFLTSHAGSEQHDSYNFDAICDKLLDTYVLGEHVGSAWELQSVMRWTPAIADKRLLKDKAIRAERNKNRLVSREIGEGITLRSSGLYKVRGATVEAVMGGIYHQFVSCSLYE